MTDYIIQTSKKLYECEYILNQIGDITHRSLHTEGLIIFSSVFDIEDLRELDFIQEIEVAPTGSF